MSTNILYLGYRVELIVQKVFFMEEKIQRVREMSALVQFNLPVSNHIAMSLLGLMLPWVKDIHKSQEKPVVVERQRKFCMGAPVVLSCFDMLDYRCKLLGLGHTF